MDAALGRAGRTCPFHGVRGERRGEQSSLAFGVVAEAGEEHSQQVRDLGEGADARVLRWGRHQLFDRDRRRQAGDPVDLWGGYRAEQVAGEGGDGFEVAALRLGVDGVEGQRRLSRAGHSADADELPVGEGDREAGQIVLMGTDDVDLLGHA